MSAGRASRQAGLALLALALPAALALVTLAGLPQRLLEGRISARLTVTEVALPHGFGVDGASLARALSEALAERATDSVALRYALGPEGGDQLIDVVLPRLLAPAALQRVLDDIPSLGPTVEAERYRSQVAGVAAARGPAEDVALSLPGALRAETPEGVALPLDEGPDGVAILRLGAIPAGETRAFRAWRDRTAAAVLAAPGLIPVGARGVDGRVALRGREAWLGAELEAFAPGRWLVAGVLAAVAARALVAAVVALAPPLSRA